MVCTEYLALQPEAQKHLIKSVESMKLLELNMTAMTVSSIPCPCIPQGLGRLENILLESQHELFSWNHKLSATNVRFV